jgi:FtsP/CotA-like multicopper oxidase with cupredoxin domain
MRPDSKLSRRLFTLAGGLGLLVAGCTAAKSSDQGSAPAPTAVPSGNASTSMADMPGMAGTPTSAAAIQQAADQMDAMDEAKMKAFPAKTAGQGNQKLPFKLDGAVKVFELTAAKIMWEVEPGKQVEAWTYNEQLPGPEIRVTEGDTVRVILHNELPESTVIHWHGLRTPHAMDGVPFLTQPPVKPGQSFTYEFVAKPAGTHMYHSHENSAKQVGMGLLGAFIVEPKDPATRPTFDKEYTLILNDGGQGFTLTGKSFPATAPLTAKVGQKVLVRFMNEGQMIHPMHLHGFPMQVIAKDGYLLPQPYLCDTLNIAPGDRWEVLIDADTPGAWAFHCHILSHAEGPQGMFGMVTALIVEK